MKEFLLSPVPILTFNWGCIFILWAIGTLAYRIAFGITPRGQTDAEGFVLLLLIFALLITGLTL